MDSKNENPTMNGDPTVSGPETRRAKLRLLLVDGNPGDARLFSDILEEQGREAFEMECVEQVPPALRRLSQGGIDALLLALAPSDPAGLGPLVQIIERFPDVPVLVLAATRDERIADQALRLGAQDCILAGEFDGRSMARAIRFAIERRRGDSALRLSQERYELMALATNDAVWDWHITANRLWWNVGVRCFLGDSPDHRVVDPASWTERIHPEDRERVICSLRSMVENKGPYWIEEHRFRCTDGSYAWVYNRGYLIRDSGGRPVRMIGAMSDITDRRRAEDTLRETNETLRTLVQASPLGITLTDAAGKVKIWNPAAERILGLEVDQVLGLPLGEIAPLARATGIPFLVPQLLGDRPLMGVEVHTTRPDGTPIDLSLSSAPLRDARGNASGAMAVVDDITGRKRADQQKAELEEQLRQSHKMEAVGRLAGGVAHDFNNLMSAVAGFGEMVYSTFEPGDPRAAHMEELLKATDRAVTLTRQLLAFSRRQVLQPKVINLNKVVERIEALLRRLIGEHIDLGIVLDPGLASVRADYGQIEQVLMNLAINARDAMPSGGKLTIETRCVNLDGNYFKSHERERRGPHVMVCVSDAGCGMDPETQSHLFEPFFTTKEKGTGLGLATVYGIVKQSGGDIWVYSEPGHGTTFKIYFPSVEQQPLPEHSTTTRIRPLTGHERILLTEDSEPVRRLLKELLTLSGYDVLVASDGEEALQLVKDQSRPIDLLFTDVVMPRMSGRELVARLKPQRPEMKVLYMSGYTEEAISRHGILDPGTAFLEKPFTPHGVAKKVREVLDMKGAMA